ncbi:acyltransferase family protein [Streptomyces sp. IBSNAI002]|uniref:acyltransferase family protein n=1 Tax=Streptomyces sp. IBSNAI002 TaxID=3457500 RepID=UPI003FD29193
MPAPVSPVSPGPVPGTRRHRLPPGGPGQASGRRPHLAPLDGLRGLAVLGVLLFHAGDFPGGFLGVDLFFVLSGYLITGLLLREAGERGGIDLVAFWGRRARRLLPALAAAVAGALLLTRFAGSGAMARFAHQDAPWVLANLANWHFIAEQVGYWHAVPTRTLTHLWSIAVEEQFYLLWPPLVLLLMWLGSRPRRGGGRPPAGGRLVAVTALLGAVASAALMALLADPVDTTRVYEGTDTRAFALLLGALAATPPVQGCLARLPRRTAGRLMPVPAAVLALVWATASGTGQPWLFQGGLLLHSAAAAALIALVAHAPTAPLGRVLGLRPLTVLGGLSYGLYLWHWPLFLVLDHAGPALDGWARTCWLTAVSLAAAVLSKTLLEDPVRYRARWAHGRSGALALALTVIALAALWWSLTPVHPDPGSVVDLDRLTG